MITITVTIATIALLTLGFLGPNLAQAHTEAYKEGYNMGYNNAENGIAIDTGFLDSHSQHWQIGDQDGWNAGKGIANTNQQSESSSVSIRGNGNDVTVEQGELNSQGSGDGSSGLTFRGDIPRCVLVCSVMR